MRLEWEMSGLNWVAGPYECRLIPAPKGSRPGTRHRWQPLYEGEPIGRPECMIKCRWAAREHHKAAIEG